MITNDQKGSSFLHVGVESSGRASRSLDSLYRGMILYIGVYGATNGTNKVQYVQHGPKTDPK